MPGLGPNGATLRPGSRTQCHPVGKPQPGAMDAEGPLWGNSSRALLTGLSAVQRRSGHPQDTTIETPEPTRP